jgi:hypothetical protein
VLHYCSGQPLHNLSGVDRIVRGAIREDDLGGFGDVVAYRNEKPCGVIDILPEEEGAFSVRVLNHFYDPIFNRGLVLGTWAGFACTYIAPNNKCLSSVDWALGFVDSFDAQPEVDENGNHFSYQSARNNYWFALTAHAGAPGEVHLLQRNDLDAQERMYRWATLFRSLGDVIHLLQDTAQPQHTRNDYHGPGATSAQGAFEGYVNARALQNQAKLAGDYVRGFYFGEVDLPQLRLGVYPNVMFAAPQRFFTTRTASEGLDPTGRLGLADYSNRGFFTGGTLPGMTGDFYIKPELITSATYSLVKSTCLGLLHADSRIAATCGHYLHNVPDSVHPDYIDGLESGYSSDNAPLASQSIFTDRDVQSESVRTAMGLEELQVTADLAVPRAIGYSTGLIDYFFRGELVVTPPTGGIFAIVNHGTPHIANSGVPYLVSDSTKAFGFTKVRLRVQNTTKPVADPGLGSIEQTTGGANSKIVAVATYHRNACYRPDLAGEQTKDLSGTNHFPPNCQTYTPGSEETTIRTVAPEMSVSAEISVTPGMIDGTPASDREFDFSDDPIPVNATDVFIQVAYRGKLGQENDGIAVGNIDVSEPTYESVLAITDIPLQYQEDGSTWSWSPWTASPWAAYTSPLGHSSQHSVPDPVQDLAIDHIEICDGPWQIYLSSESEQLPEDHIVRIAALRDDQSHVIKSQVSFKGKFEGPSGVSTYTRSRGDVNQAMDELGNGFQLTYKSWLRGIAGTGGVANIPTCVDPYPLSDCPDYPSPEPSMSQLPPIFAEDKAEDSEAIGIVKLPGDSACTITADYGPYSIQKQTLHMFPKATSFRMRDGGKYSGAKGY